MRHILWSMFLVSTLGCNSKPAQADSNQLNSSKNLIQTGCNENYDTLLTRYGNTFDATTMNLSKSLNPDLNLFLLKVDTNCLRSQKEYEKFISLILAKLFLHHLKCCNQSYDLQSMEQDGGKMIVNEFKRMAGYQNQNMEMLSSATVVLFIQKNPDLKEAKEISSLLKMIEKEKARIKKGI
jgi:hypothetical protein